MYEPVHDSMIPSLTEAAQNMVGWGGIEFLYFVGGVIVLAFLWKVLR